MWLARFGTLSIQAIQSVLAVDTLEEHPPLRREPKGSQVFIQIEPRPPIGEFELRNGIPKVTSYGVTSREQK